MTCYLYGVQLNIIHTPKAKSFYSDNIHGEWKRKHYFCKHFVPDVEKSATGRSTSVMNAISMLRPNSKSLSIQSYKDAYKLSHNLPTSLANASTLRSSISHQDCYKTCHVQNTPTCETSSWTFRNLFEESFHAKNLKRKATIMMSMRSNAKGVRELVSTVNKKCDEARRTSTISEAGIPYYECAMLAEIADDAFYRVVIRSANGIATIVRAMKVFTEYASLQEVCCNSLENLYVRNGSDLQDEKNVESIQQIVAAMRMHTSSVAVQSAACDALRVLSHVAFTPQSQLSSQLMSDIVDVLTKAKDRLIAPQSKQRAAHLLLAVELLSAVSRRV